MRVATKIVCAIKPSIERASFGDSRLELVISETNNIAKRDEIWKSYFMKRDLEIDLLRSFVAGIGGPDDDATCLLPPMRSALAKAHPRLQFEVTCDNASDLLPMLTRGQLDVVVATHRPDSVAGQVARHEPLHWVASPDFIDDHDQPLSLVLFPSGCVCREIALDVLKRIDRRWRVAYSTRSIGLIEKALLDGSSVSVMEASVIPPGLRIIDGQAGLPSLHEVVISVHQPNTCEAHVSLAADFLIEKLGRAPLRALS